MMRLPYRIIARFIPETITTFKTPLTNKDITCERSPLLQICRKESVKQPGYIYKPAKSMSHETFYPRVGLCADHEPWLGARDQLSVIKSYIGYQ